MSRCPVSDAVVAHYLDGEPLDLLEVSGVDGLSAFEMRELVREHRDECVECQSALREARRLDAVVAATAEHEVSDDLADRWIDAALEQHAAPRPVPIRRPSLQAAAALLVVGIAVGVVVSRLTRPEEAPRVVAGGEPAPRVVRQIPENETGRARDLDAVVGRPLVGESGAHGIVLPERGVSRREVRRVSSGELAAAVRRAGDLWRPATWLAAGVSSGWSGVLRAVRAADSTSEVQSRLVADLVDRRAHDVLVGLLSEAGRHWSVVAEACRGSRSFCAMLERGVRNVDRGDLLTVAAGLGVPRVDAALTHRLVREPARLHAVIAGLRAPAVRPGRVALLLDLWRGLDRRGDERELAWTLRWFEGLSSRDTAEALRELDISRSAVERRRVLLALGAIADPMSARRLQEVLSGPRHEESIVAGWALGRLPAGSDDLDPHRIASRRRAVAWAVLADRRDRRALDRIRHLSLSAEERAFLDAGGFQPSQFQIAVSLFKDRRSQRGD